MSEAPKSYDVPSMCAEFLWDWRDNEFARCLQALHDQEPRQRLQIEKAIAEMKATPLFWHLLSRYTDALSEAERAKDVDLQNRVLFTMLARFFVAGSLRFAPVFDEARLEKGRARGE